MKKKIASLLAALSCAFAANAALINITNDAGALVDAIPQGYLDNQNADTVFTYLVDVIIPGYNAIPDLDPELVAPVFADYLELPSLNDDSGSIDLTGFDYAAVHYGQIEVFYFLNGVTSYDFGADDIQILNPDWNGRGQGNQYLGGGLSNIKLYKINVPDSGTTIILLGGALLALVGIRSRKN